MNTAQTDYKFGYTDDGKVWISLRALVKDNPMEIFLEWNPEGARAVANSILSAAKALEEKNERDSPNPN